MDVDAVDAVDATDAPHTLTQTAAEVIIRNVPPDTAVVIVTEILGGDTAVLKEYKCDANTIGFHDPDTGKFVKIERQEIEACDHGYLIAAFLQTLEEVDCGPTAVRDAWVQYCDGLSPAYDVDTRPPFEMPGSNLSKSSSDIGYDHPLGCVVVGWARLLGFMTMERLRQAVIALEEENEQCSEYTRATDFMLAFEFSLEDILEGGVECSTSAPLRRPALTILLE